eukprot:gb/GECH01010130.1/.p1 GENE.gb/GECH01010130.1/~~gb/GECH01010130.1/.p1  ORF type:complete len:167 (+),score=6.02 gb/GECH01010130.1/:1-501(+)
MVETRLHYETNEGNVTEVKRLIGGGYNANETDEAGAVPLHYACAKGHISIVKYLLQIRDIDPNVQITSDKLLKWTPLHLACAEGQAEVVHELCDHHKLDVNRTNHQGETPLHLACACGHKEVITELLKHDQINVNLKTAYCVRYIFRSIGNNAITYNVWCRIRLYS